MPRPFRGPAAGPAPRRSPARCRGKCAHPRLDAVSGWPASAVSWRHGISCVLAEKRQCYHWAFSEAALCGGTSNRSCAHLADHNARIVLIAVLAAGAAVVLAGSGPRHDNNRSRRRSSLPPSSRPAQPAGSRRRAQQPPRSAAAAADSVGDQLRPRRRHRHRRQGRAGPRPQAGRVHGDRGWQAAEDRTVLGREDRRRRADRSRPPPRSAATSTRSAKPRVPMSGCSCCCSTTTTCGAATTWRCASRSIDFVQNQLDPADMVAVMYPLTPVADISFSRNRSALISAIEQFEGRKFDYRPRNPMEEQYALLPGADGRADPQPGDDGRAEGCRGAPRRAARGAQVDHLRQRRLHDHAAGAAERSDRGDARRRQPGSRALRRPRRPTAPRRAPTS